MSSSQSKPQLTPMLRQYHEIKKQYPGTILFYRMGDFYELFFEDAIIGAREMEITLTARHKERGEPIPMCGFPHHAATGYIAKLIKKGYRIAVCEQTEDPKSTTKLVKRDVVRVITPGTALETQLLESKQNCYLASVCGSGEGMGLAILDLSTGEFMASQFKGDTALLRIREQLDIFAPKEIIHPNSLTPILKPRLSDQEHARGEAPSLNASSLRVDDAAPLTGLDDWVFGFEHSDSLLRTQLGVASLDGFGLSEDKNYAISAAGAAVHYILETQKAEANHISEITYFEPSEFLLLDAATVQNLDLVSDNKGGAKYTLFGIIDETMTGMGARLLRQWLLRPSVRIAEIEARLDAVEELKSSSMKRDSLRTTLESMSDLERLAGKVTLGRATPRDLLSLKQSIATIPTLRKLLSDTRSSLLQIIGEGLDELDDIKTLIASAISDEPPATANEAGMIRDGYNNELDELRNIAGGGKSFIAAIEARERGRTNISSLKVKFNNVFGYFIEISNANKDRVPPEYERKQTLVNAERYTTPELKEYEGKVLGAEARILEIEVELFAEIRRTIAKEIKRLQGVARAIAILDCTASLSQIAAKRNYVRPHLHEGDEIVIRGGRHPIVETMGERFVPNDLIINNATDRLLIITGPNMGGKSVYLKQSALIVILAQMGSFVPAGSAKIALIDRIFTRIGASDNIAGGRSTFMVEMTETSNILNTATARSLVLLDEVGRGTATFDGLSLAWAIAEYLHDDSKHSAKTIFATHYHEMTELSKMRPGVKNYQVAVSDANGDIVFLRKVIEGSAGKSFGIDVARLAGLPKSVLERAREILNNLEANELDVTGKPKFAKHLRKPSKHVDQLNFFNSDSE